MTAIGFQLHSLHAVDEPLPTVIGRVGDAGFEGVEFAGLGDADPAAVAAALDETGLAPAGAHVALDALEADPGVVETYRGLGCQNLAVPWLAPETFASRSSVVEVAARLDAVARTLEARGLRLDYHNHDQEFRALDGGVALETLLESTGAIGFQLDLGWAGAAGHDPLALLDRYADRIASVHLKDYDAAAGEPVAVGEGDLDVGAAIDAVRTHGVDWLLYEAEGRPDSYETLAHAAAVLDAYW
jgi:sugar phosphate isomerase/epimerase